MFRVPGPDPVRERLVDLLTDGAGALAKRFNARPSRTTLTRWRSDGYPVGRGGPRVKLPTCTQMRRVKTSEPALGRFLGAIADLEEQIADAGGLDNWLETQDARSNS